jgi:hypothetical protein
MVTDSVGCSIVARVKTLCVVVVLVGCADINVQPGTYLVTSWIHSVPDGTTFTIAPRSDGGIEVTSDEDLFLVDVTNIPPDGSSYASLRFSGRPANCEAGPNKTCSFTRREVTVSAPSATTVVIDQCNESFTDWNSCTSITPSCTASMAEQSMPDACQRFDRLAGTRIP